MTVRNTNIQTLNGHGNQAYSFYIMVVYKYCNLELPPLSREVPIWTGLVISANVGMLGQVIPCDQSNL